MNIRRMTAADVSAAARLEREIFSLPWSEAAFATAVADQNARFLVAEERAANGGGDASYVIAGYIGMYLSPPEGEITNVAVAEAFRGRGFGKALVCSMQQAAKTLGIEQIFLEVRDSNETAIHVYQWAGFEQIGVRRGFYERPREDARVMKWSSLC